VTAWKDLERRVCRDLGGERRGPVGRDMSDCVGIPYAVEVKRSSRAGPPVLSAWVQQAKEQGAREGLPWLLVVAGHGDRRPIVCRDFDGEVALIAAARAGERCREALEWIADPSYVGNYGEAEVIKVHREWARAVLRSNQGEAK
jgi:hypothetical protein